MNNLYCLKNNRSAIGRLAVSILLCFPGRENAQAQPACSLKQRLDKIDAKLLDTKDEFTVAEMAMKLPASVAAPDQGWSLQDVKLIFGKNYTALIQNSTYPQQPRYFPPNSTNMYREYDYDDDGNLVVWRKTKSVCVCTDTSNVRLDITQRQNVSPRGDIVSSGTNVTVGLYRPRDVDQSMPEFGNFLLLTGHGLSRYLSETGSDVVTTGPDGTIRGKAKGLYAGAILGEVNATLVGDDLPIVRQASLMESNSPVLEIQTTGTVQGEDGLPYARQGILRNYTVRGPAGSYDISLTKLFRVRRVHASDQDLVRVKQEQSYELHPDTTSVIDFRGGKQKISNLQRPGKLSEVENLIEN